MLYEYGTFCKLANRVMPPLWNVLFIHYFFPLSADRQMQFVFEINFYLN